jgi:2-keto-4-pentenoate hydratase/2-oxohepta-3-ene-1,7-dioic acid hydratase in catechol pathway
LQAGDVIYTGTPEGVGAIHLGDVLRLTWSPYIEQEFVLA